MPASMEALISGGLPGSCLDENYYDYHDHQQNDIKKVAPGLDVNIFREVAWAMVTWSKERLDEVARYGEAR